jgi:hypothetical protein
MIGFNNSHGVVSWGVGSVFSKTILPDGNAVCNSLFGCGEAAVRIVPDAGFGIGDGTDTLKKSCIPFVFP